MIAWMLRTELRRPKLKSQNIGELPCGWLELQMLYFTWCQLYDRLELVTL